MESTLLSPREKWLVSRMSGLGASDSPAAIGISPFKSPFQLWAEKSGLSDPDDLSGNEAVEFGVRLERPVAEAFADRTGRSVEMWPPYTIVRDPKIPWLLCTPDAKQVAEDRGEGLVQVKTTSAFNASEWADEPPLYYQVQLQHELAVTGFDWGTLVVLIGGQKMRYFDVKRNDRFIEALLPKLAAFWESVEKKTPPEVDGSLATAKVLAKLHPEDNGQTVELPAEAHGWTVELEDAKAAIKAAEAIKTECENRIKAALGSATFGMLPDGSRWSWKTQNRAGYTVEPTSFRVLRKVQ